MALDLLQPGVAALLRAAAARAAAAPASAPAPPLHTAPLHPDRDVRHREPKADHGAGSGCEDRAAAAALLAPFRSLPGTDGDTLPSLPNAHGDRVRSPNGWLSTSKEACKALFFCVARTQSSRGLDPPTTAHSPNEEGRCARVTLATAVAVAALQPAMLARC